MIETFKREEKRTDLFPIIDAFRLINTEFGSEVFRNGKRVFALLADLVPDCSFIKLFEIALNSDFFSDYFVTRNETIRTKFIKEKSEISGLCEEAIVLVLEVVDTVFGNSELLTDLSEQTKDIQLKRKANSSRLKESLKALKSQSLEDQGTALQVLQEEAQNGNPEAQYNLGKLSVQGVHVSKNIENGIQLLSKAAHQKQIEACLFLSNFYHVGEDTEIDLEESLYWLDLIDDKSFPPEALPNKAVLCRDLGYGERAYLYAKKAVEKFPTGLSYLVLGSLYETGIGTPKDYKEAARWYLKAGEAGEAQGYLCLGGLYSVGFGVEKNLSKAFDYYLQGAQSGDPLCLNAVGYTLENGIGTIQNFQKAAEYYRKGAIAGNSASAYNLGRVYLEGKGVGEDLNAAIRWLEESARYNNIQALSLLVAIYTEPSYLRVNGNKAKSYVERLIVIDKDNNGKNYLILGNLLRNDQFGCQLDEVSAIEYYKKSADLGEPLGLNNLGVEYLTGDFVDLNISKAVSLFEKALDEGCDEAAANLAYMKINGMGIPQDIREATDLLKRPAENGNLMAQEYLGQIYFEGWAGTRDYKLASYYLDMAYKNGSQLAAQYLMENYKLAHGTWKIKKGLFSKMRDPRPLPEQINVETGKGGCETCKFKEYREKNIWICKKIEKKVFEKKVCPHFEPRDPLYGIFSDLFISK